MSDAALRAMLREAEADGGAAAWARAATAVHRAAGDDPAALRLAASAFDRAYGLAPGDEALAAERKVVLDRLEVREHGLVFRYVPAGPFLMGSEEGEPDERPVHEVALDGFWITDVPVSWGRYCALMGWLPPAEGGMPTGAREEREPAFELAPGRTVTLRRFEVWNDNKVRLQYCEDHTPRAHDWHSHAPDLRDGQLFPRVPRDDPHRPYTYEDKPMVAMSWQEAWWLTQRLTALSSSGASYFLPTEPQWEKAARGGLVGRRYAWGDEPPEGRCDFGAFERFGLLPSRAFSPNAYGVFAMCGGVWEWTNDDYDAAAYSRASPPADAEPRQKVLRGGSWSDCAEAVTVSFRMARSPAHGGSPNVGVRLVRT